MKQIYLVIAATLSILLPLEASAYVLSRNSSGTILRWPAPAYPKFHANWANSSGLSYGDVFNAFTNSFQRWKYTGTSSVNFDYWQGSNGATPANYGNDGINAIFFASQSSQDLGGSVLAATYVYSISGVIVETDIEFNDETVDYTTNVSDSNRSTGGLRVFLENVATHEFGHAFGLSHSASLQSSMVYIEDRAQAKPSCDDAHGIAELYPYSGFTSGRGAIQGSVVKTGGAPVFGAHVLAISKTRGAMVASAISKSDGNYTIPNLEPGEYYLLIEPFQSSSPLSSLCGGSASGCFFGAMNSQSVCGASSPFKRMFVQSASGFPSVITVSAGSTAATGTSNLSSCTAMTDSRGASVTSISASTPTLISDNSGAEASAAANGVIGATNSSHYFKLSNVSGDIAVRVLSYGLYSPFDPSVTLVDSAGSVVAGSISTDNVFSNTSGYVNYDSSATFTGAPAGNYYVKITNKGSLGSTLYPAGGVSGQIDSVRYYLAIVTINDSTTLLPNTAEPTLANNVRCESLATLPLFADHGPPTAVSSGGSGSKQEESSGGGCGTTTQNHSGDGGPGGPAVFSAWGIAFMLLVSRLVTIAKRRVSR